MRIVFFGSPGSALPSLQSLLDAGHDIPLVVTQSDKPAGRGKKMRACAVKVFAEGAGLPVFQTRRIRKDPRAIPLLHSIDPDLHVVAAFGQIMPVEIFDLPPRGSINVHFSLLPAYRGASPVQWALLNGEEVTGITIFRLNEKMDEGNVLSAKTVSVLPGETAPDLEDRLARIGAELLVRTIDDIEILPQIPQDHSKASYAPLIKKEDGRVDWSRSSGLVERMIRAFMPWPSVFTFLQGRRLKLLEVDPLEDTHSPASSGEILSIDRDGILVCCGDGSLLLITRVQPENRRPMSARDFALGSRLKPGDRFS